MMARGKKYKAVVEEHKEAKAPEAVETAIDQVKAQSYTKFAGSVEVHISTKSKEKEVSIRGSVSLPHAFGSEKKVLVFCDDKDAEKAKKAGADFAGITELKKKIEEGWMGFDVVLATPQAMGQIAMLGKVLGPKGLMPNPKAGTVISGFDAIKSFKSGKLTFKNDTAGTIHASVGKTDMETKAIAENLKAFVEAVREATNKAKATVKNIHIAPTMGPSINLPSGLV
jgi:large subunit ribosomal protein L1